MIEICFLEQQIGDEIAARQLAERISGDKRLNSLRSLKEITGSVPAGHKRLVLLKYFEDYLKFKTLSMIDKHNLQIVAMERVASATAATGSADYFAVSAKAVEKLIIKPGEKIKKCAAMVSIGNVINSRLSEIFHKMSGVELPPERLIYKPQQLYFEVSGNCELLSNPKLLKHFFPNIKILGSYEVPE